MTSSPGINSDSGLEMQTKSLFSKGSRKPNASDLVVRHPLLPPPGSRIPTTGSLGLYPAPARDEAPPDTSIFPADSGLRSVAADAFHPPRPLAFPFRLRFRLAAAAGARALPLATSPARGARGEDCSARPRPHRKPLSFRHRTRARPRSRVGSDPSLAKKDKTWQCY